MARNSTSLLLENGLPQRAVSLVEEITEHTRTSDAGEDLDTIDPEPVQNLLHDSEQRLRLVVDNVQMCAFEWDVKSDMVVRAPDCSGILGLPARDTGRHFMERLHPSDRKQYMAIVAALEPARDTYRTEYRILSGKRVYWAEERGHGFFNAKGRLIRVGGIVSEIAERKQLEDTLRTLSAWLIRAQEEERKRVARELHDGVTQKLGILSIELARTAEAAGGSHVGQRLSALYTKLQDVVSDIGHISHELHPSTLRHVGLSSALRDLCREISETHGIVVYIGDESTKAPVSKDVALCLYRVAQEALQNVVKHSRSKRVWVGLRGTSRNITLWVRDEGVGFRVESSKGLGLISMRERLRLLGGTIGVHSRVGSGTRIEARVPLSSSSSVAA